MEQSFDTIIIGGGPGGYVAAIRLAQKGQRVGVVEEREKLGGTCLNVGCIPSKILLEASARYESALVEAPEFGVSCASVSYDLEAMRARREKLVGESCGGIEFLFKKHGIIHIQGRGRLASHSDDKRGVEVALSDGSAARLEAKAVVLATGSEAVSLPMAPFEGDKIMSSNEALELKRVPERLLVIGGGAIGLELGQVYQRLGSQVSIVEMMPRLLMGVDRQVSDYLKRSLTKKGFKFYLDHRVSEVEKAGDEVILRVENAKGKAAVLQGDALLVAAGRRPFTKGLGLEEAGVKMDGPFIAVTPESFETSLPGVYAIGDVIRGPMLAHKAQEEGMALADLLTGGGASIDYASIPGVVYTHPEVAAVGPGEEELKEKGVEFVSGSAFLKGNGRAKSMSGTDGMMKLFSEPGGRMLGGHMIGPHVSEMAPLLSMAVTKGLSAKDLANTIFPHPTISEALREAALALSGEPLHG